MRFNVQLARVGVVDDEYKNSLKFIIIKPFFLCTLRKYHKKSGMQNSSVNNSSKVKKYCFVAGVRFPMNAYKNIEGQY